MHNFSSAYYPILDATNTLIHTMQWGIQRCRRNYDGPPRFVLFDEVGTALLTDPIYPRRRLGFTLREVLIHLANRSEPSLRTHASRLLAELDGADTPDDFI